jgi:glutathione synthase
MGENYILAQRYIPEAVNGDVRIIVINGEVYKEAVIRKPNRNDHRSNLASGGTIEKYLLNKNEINICNEIANFLRNEKIYFAGIDMIGSKITEINITSPTCISEINNFHDINLGIKFWEKIDEFN